MKITSNSYLPHPRENHIHEQHTKPSQSEESQSKIDPHDVKSKQQLRQIVEHLNSALPELSNNLSANIVNHGGQAMIEIRNGDTVVKRISDGEILAFVESRKSGTPHLIDQYI
ncbi:hypothetical protein [Vibrio intestinalis]|uniref:hypothetical protein n=1 Tax=Vibrio intestinalis TaxID=2933291 RepID=UPI0021A2A997|nr:hypothetical protein [Vibrio intestinalis]